MRIMHKINFVAPLIINNVQPPQARIQRLKEVSQTD